MIVFSIIGALIGAGFASGQEMYLFFYRFGIGGIFGLVLCSALIGLVIYKTFLILYKNKNIQNYHDFLRSLGSFWDGDFWAQKCARKSPSPNNTNIKHNSKYIFISYILYYDSRIWSIF